MSLEQLIEAEPDLPVAPKFEIPLVQTALLEQIKDRYALAMKTFEHTKIEDIVSQEALLEEVIAGNLQGNNFEATQEIDEKFSLSSQLPA